MREHSGLSTTATGSRGVGFLPRTGALPLPPGRPSSSSPHPGVWGGGGVGGRHPPHPPGEDTLLPHPGVVTLHSVLLPRGGDPSPPLPGEQGEGRGKRTGIRARTRYGNPDRQWWLPEKNTTARANAESKSTCVACALYI